MKKMLLYLFDGAVPLISRIIARWQRLQNESAVEELKGKLQSCGPDVRISPKADLRRPEGIAIGCNVHIGDDSFLSGEGGIQIQDHVHISRRVTIYGSDHAFRESGYLPYGPERNWKQVIIERNVWIGMNACILPGVTIGEGAIIGMGAVVAKDVPPLSIVGQGPYRVLGSRDERKYRKLDFDGCFGGPSGYPKTKADVQEYRSGRPRFNPDEIELTFVVTTGRSGSTTLARVLNDHPNIHARHEPRMQLIKWSNDYAHSNLNETELEDLLSDLLLTTSYFPPGIHNLESDQKYSFMIPTLAKMLPNAKFIWLTRSAEDVVASSWSRGWYGDPDHDVSRRRDNFYDKHRLQGDKVGSVSDGEWLGMSPFEKNCWYWFYVNNLISEELSKLEADRWIRVQIESLEFDMKRIQSFLGVPSHEIRTATFNQAHYSISPQSSWDHEQKEQFEHWCGKLMRDLY